MTDALAPTEELLTEVLVSTYTARGAKAGAAAGATGIGLVRTEMMFLGHHNEPAVTDQAAAYQAVLEPLDGRPAVFRVWDLGSDKTVPFATPAASSNPALGERGIRYLRRDPGLLDRQLAAIAEATASSTTMPAVMAPMISVPEEAAWFAQRARHAGIARIGAMIEVPAAVLLAAEVMATVDFVSIGTNDLLQYTFATDRGTTGVLSELIDMWQPALLRLIALVVQTGQACACPVAVCGEAAAEPAFAAVLAGLGVATVSVRPNAVAAVRTTLTAAGPGGCARAYAAAAAAPDHRAARTAAISAVADCQLG